MKITKGKVQFFETILADFFRKSGRSELPWRRTGITAYEVWISEIMLQQTQVSRVMGYYERFLKKFPTVEQLAKVSWEQFLPYYEGLGYYARGRNMLKTAQVVVEEYRGVFPGNATQLRLLPGIGAYTAGAILSFAYGQETLAWDTNLKRVIGRFFYGSKKAAINEEWFVKTLTTKRKKLNAALMDFGSSICTSNPKCANCPLQSKCVYFQTGGQKEPDHSTKRSVTGREVDWKNAQVVLFLHENHKQYYSAHPKKFVPFVLSSTYNTRSAIKTFFLERHGLRLAVRPPHQKLVYQGIPTLLVNAQILAGEPHFSIFPKQAVTGYNKDNF